MIKVSKITCWLESQIGKSEKIGKVDNLLRLEEGKGS